MKGVDQSGAEDSGPRTVTGWATAIQRGASPTVQFSVTGNTNSGLFSTAPAVNATTGTLTYTPAPNAFGIATITLVLTGTSGSSTPQSFTITVLPVNDAPSFTLPQSLTVLPGTDARSVPFVQQYSAGPANEATQVVRFTVEVALNPALFAVAPAISSTGVLSYTLAPNALGPAILRVRMADDGGTVNGGVDAAASSQFFTLLVERPNRAPTAGPVSLTTREDFRVDGVFAGRDPDGDPLTYSLARAPEYGTVDLYRGLSRFTFRPADNWYGTVTFAYTVSDGRLSATGIVTVTVTPLNDPPTALEEPPYEIWEGFGPVLHFSDPDMQPSSDYRGTLDLGNGRPATRTTIHKESEIFPGSPMDLYSTNPAPPYQRFGTYNATATITDRRGGSTTVFRKIVVRDAPLFAAALTASATASSCRSYGLRVACISDYNPDGRVSDLSASISFGDGTRAVDGRVRLARPADNCGDWPWAVEPRSAHVYGRTGTYTATTVVRSIGGSTVTATMKIYVP